MKEIKELQAIMDSRQYVYYIGLIDNYNMIEEALRVLQMESPPKRQAILLERSRAKIEAIEELYELDRPF